jgi:hypothetical protein
LRLARKITHKRVCRTYELLKFGETLVISMEFVKGESLRAILRRFGDLSPNATIRLMKQLCEGLQEAHSQSIIHRDLKPENIILDPDGNAKVMDFGIARSLELATGTGEAIGTPGHMAPEQAEGKSVDQRTDVYALGVIAYEALTGSPVFRAETPLALLYKAIEETPKTVRELNPSIPSFLDIAVNKCLQKDPSKRFQSVAELAQALHPDKKSITSATASSFPEDVAPPRWNRKDWMLAACGVICLAMFLFVFIRSGLASHAGLSEDPVVLVRLSEEYAKQLGASPQSQLESQSFGMRSLYDFVAQTQGSGPTLDATAKGFPFWEWYTKWQDNDTGLPVTIWIDREGRFRGFRREFPAVTEDKNLPLPDAKRAAELAVRNMIDIDPATYTLASQGEVVRNGQVANEFLWEKSAIFGLHHRVMVRVLGSQFQSVVQWYELPNNFSWKKPINWQIGVAIAASLLMIVLGLFQVRFVNLTEKWRLWWAGIAFPLGGWGAYWDMTSDDVVRPYFFVVVGLISSIIFFTGAVVIERYLADASHSKLAGLRALTEWDLDRRWISVALLRGTAVGLILLALDSLLVAMCSKFLRGWPEAFINVEIQGWYMSRWSPGLQIFAAALLQMFGIGLLLGVFSAITWRFCRSTFLRWTIPALILGVGGVSWYMGAVAPNYLKIPVLVIEFSVLTYSFVRYDFLTTLSGIFTFSFLWGTVSIILMRGKAGHASEYTLFVVWCLILFWAIYCSAKPALQRAARKMAEAV